MPTLTIGHVAKMAGVSVHTVRFYERNKLFSPMARSESGYRQFDPQIVSIISFIRNAKDLGFTLTEIKDLLALQKNPHATSFDVKQKTAAKIAGVDKKIEKLLEIRAHLAMLARSCNGKGMASECCILEGIAAKPN